MKMTNVTREREIDAVVQESKLKQFLVPREVVHHVVRLVGGCRTKSTLRRFECGAQFLGYDRLAAPTQQRGGDTKTSEVLVDLIIFIFFLFYCGGIAFRKCV
jgi:hypothetical protein